MWQSLRSLGLSEYQAKVTVAASSLGSATAKQIATTAKLPQNKVYEVLEQLEKEGIIASRQLRPKLYLVHSVAELHRRAQERKQAATQAIELLAQLRASAPQKEEPFYLIRGQRNIIQ